MNTDFAEIFTNPIDLWWAPPKRVVAFIPRVVLRPGTCSQTLRQAERGRTVGSPLSIGSAKWSPVEWCNERTEVGPIVPDVDTATVDRLLHHAHLVQTSGESIRLSQAVSGAGVVALT